MASKKDKAKSKVETPKEEKPVDLTLSDKAKAAAPAAEPKEGLPVSEAKEEAPKNPKAKKPRAKKPPKPKIEDPKLATVVRLSRTALSKYKDQIPEVDKIVTSYHEGEMTAQEAICKISDIVQVVRAS